MAQQRQKEQFEDPLGSIFDFIFSQSEKDPSKVKPAKVTGIDGTSEFADALVATLENPLLFVNDTTMEAFQEGLDIDLVKVKFGDRDAGGTIKFNLQDIGAIVKDPGKFIDKQFATQEFIRKSQKVAHSGEIMRSVIAGTWATKKGLDRDTRNAMMGVGRPQAFRADMMKKSDELMEEHFIRGTKKIKESQLKSRYGASKGEDLFKLYQEAKAAYQSGDPKKRREVYTGGAINELYSILEGEEISQKWRSAGSIEEKAKYRQARQFVDNMTVLASTPNDVLGLRGRKGDIKEYFNKSKKEIEKRERHIADLRRQGASPREIAMQRKMVRNIKSDMKMARNYDYSSRLGQYEGYLGTAKDLFVEGNLLPNIINGKFFDAGRNQIPWLQPSMDLRSKEATRAFKIKPTDKKTHEVSFHREKFAGSKLLDNYYDGMNAVYYLSPATLVRSLSTGEIFAYRAHRVEKAFKKKMGEELTKTLSGFKMDDFLEQVRLGNGQAYIGRWSAIGSKRVQDLLGKAENFISKEEWLNRLTYRFSAISRMREKVKSEVSGWLSKRGLAAEQIREKIGDKLLKLGFIKEFSSAAVESWVQNGGLYGLVKGLVSAGLQAIGVSVGGPIGSAVAAAITWVATEVIIKATKPILKLGVKTAILSVLGIFGLFVLLFGSFHMMTFSKYAHVAPDQVEECDAYEPPRGEEPIEGCGVYPQFSSNLTCCMKNTLGIPPSLVYAIEEAANAYNAPPSLLLAVIYGEGYLNPGSPFYDESFVAEHIRSCAQIPGCDPDGEMIIFNIYKKWWEADAVKVFDPNREPYPCNILDGLFSVAKTLQSGRYGSEHFQSPSGEPYTCFGIPLNTLTSTSVSCDDWSNSDVISAIRRWQFGYFYDHDTLSCATKANSCLLGGGLAAQCPTGGDTCETISNPSPGGRSHTGCLWDIYQANKSGDCIERVGPPGGGTEWGEDPPEGTQPLPGYTPPTDTSKRACIFSPETIYPMRCTQGAFGSYSHENLLATDLAAKTAGTPFWAHAPSFCDKDRRNCVVRKVGHETYINSSGILVDCGGRVMIEVHNPGLPHLQIDVLHVTYSVSQGQFLDSYQPFAYVTHSAEWSNCSSGLHAHVEIKKMVGEGSFSNVNPYPVLTSEPYNCDIGTCP